MNIAIDYDETFSSDPETFLKIIKVFQEAGHTCYCVTARSDSRCDVVRDATGIQVIPTSQKAKSKECYFESIDIDIWIDDDPLTIHYDIDNKPMIT